MGNNAIYVQLSHKMFVICINKRQNQIFSEMSLRDVMELPKWVTDFSLETRRKQRRVWVLEALHWETERCRRIMHTCARTNYTDRTTYFSNMSEFHKRSLRIISILNVTTSRQTTIKCRQSQYILLTYIYWAYEATGLHRPVRQRNVNNQFKYQNKSADWSRARLASGIPPENRSRSNRARYRSGVTQK